MIKEMKRNENYGEQSLHYYKVDGSLSVLENEDQRSRGQTVKKWPVYSEMSMPVVSLGEIELKN